MPTHQYNDSSEGKNAPFKSARRETRRPKRGGRDRQISVRSVQREQPDARKLARAVIALAIAQAEAEAAAQAEVSAAAPPKKPTTRGSADES